MPYIKPEEKVVLIETTTSIAANITKQTTVGHLNYLITVACREYLDTIGESYKTINDVIGVLECAKLEFYRRIASGYENDKIKENGDVY